MTICQKPQQFLIRYVQMTYSPVWLEILDCRLAIYYDGKRASINDYATALPCDHDRKLMKNGYKESNRAHSASKAHWSRLRRGKISVVENPLTQRIEQWFPQLKAIRNHPLWFVLGNPLANTTELKHIISRLKPTLENKLFYASHEDIEFQYKTLFSTPEHLKLAESIDAFTLKLVIYRLRRLNSIGREWSCDLNDLTLHLFRICAKKSYACISHRLMRLFLIFIHSNKHEVISKLNIQRYLGDICSNQVYQEAFQLISPTPHNGVNHYPTLESYLASNQAVVQNFWNHCFEKWKDEVPEENFFTEALYWVDRASSIWLAPNMKKEELYAHNPTLLEEHYEYVVNERLKKIW